MDWREATEEEKMYIKKQYLPKEIVSAILTLILDILIVTLMIFMIVEFRDAFTVIIDIFLAFILYITFVPIIKSVRSIRNLMTDRFSIAECTLSSVDTKSVGLMKSSYVTAVSKSGESYSMNYSSPFVTKVSQGQKVYLVNLNSSMEIIL